MLTKKHFALLALVTVALLAGCATEPEVPEPETQPQPPAQTQMQTQAPTPTPAPPAPAASACSCTCPACPEATTRAIIASATTRPVPLAPQAEMASPAAAASTPAKTGVPASAKAAAEGGFNLEPGFYIKVGVFSVQENAKTAYKKLVAAGLPAVSYSTDTQKGALTRIRVGPYPTRIAALDAVKKVHALQLDGFVVQY
ncbi:MAG: SPOR domain-containing protein [Rhodoferax sp.]|nr:SPOR domain-containing protein [Rhodoferax sp.]